MALAFTAVTAICLALLATLALRLDATSGANAATADVAERATGLARAVYFDGGMLHLEPLDEDELATGASLVAIYRLDGDAVVATPAYRSGQHAADLSDDQRNALVADVLDAQDSVTARYPGRAGHEFAWAAAPVYDGDTVGAVVVAGQDMEAQRAAHDRLALGLWLGCLALLIAAAASGYALSGRAMRPATAALAQQEQFLTEAAHELRTPLATLRLSVEAGDPDDRTRALATVDRLDRLLTALLTRARIEAGSFEPERLPLRLDQVVEEVVAETSPGDRDRVRFSGEAVVVVGDPILLGQAARNLIENALRHAPGPVEVVVADGGLVVRDQGPGIAPVDRAAVLGAGVGSGTGTGTGLAIVNWVAELHGAAFTLADAPGGGLEAELRFPER